MEPYEIYDIARSIQVDKKKNQTKGLRLTESL
jgi:hypothetical protein